MKTQAQLAELASKFHNLYSSDRACDISAAINLLDDLQKEGAETVIKPKPLLPRPFHQPMFSPGDLDSEYAKALEEGFQHRVLQERIDLGTKISLLKMFIGGAVFMALDHEERSRLHRQLEHMQKYHDVLGERIMAFK